MSLSLSSLLNPSPDAEPQTAPPQPEDSLPPIQHVQSPEQHYATSPQTAQHPQQRYSYAPASEHDAVHALAALSGSGAPPPIRTSWYGQPIPEQSHDRRGSSYDRRPGSSGYNEPIQLPPPSSTGRKMSSPTLDQYHVASRSPEQRRASLISPAQATFTLPPIQSWNSGAADPVRQASHPQAHPAAYEGSHAASSRVETSLTDTPATMRQDYNREAVSDNQESLTADFKRRSPPAPLQVSASNVISASEAIVSSPANIKQESMPTPLLSSPQPTNGDTQNLTAVASLKKEHRMRTQSPLRDSSVPVPSTETSIPEPTVPKKRPAPSKTKKGMATTTKKAPPAKKRKVEPKRSVTPSSRASKPPAFKTGSSKGTPANSSPAPSTRSQSDEANDEYDEDEDMDEGDYDADGDVYCICRKPDNGTFMIGCDGTCDDWFHGKCVGIEERDKNLIDKYVCPNCTKAGTGRTNWKRICRRSGCRQPARVGKTKGGKDGSKYCSEECGVLYFREMVARTRGREDVVKNRGSRRKGSIVERPPIEDDDLGARGGVIAAGELKSLVDSSKTAEDFKRLGEGVLSPPATPDAKFAAKDNSASKDSSGDFTESETQILRAIHRQKDDARRKHQLLKDRMKFVTLAKQAASRTATEKELKPKEYCGYDSRLEWTAAQFGTWRESVGGRQAFELDTLAATEKSGSGADKDAAAMDVDVDVEEEFEHEVCDRKKCARHLEWNKLAVDDVRFEMSDNSDRMRALDREERGMRERAALRSKAGALDGEGRVEVHSHEFGSVDGVEEQRSAAAVAETAGTAAIDAVAAA